MTCPNDSTMSKLRSEADTDIREGGPRCGAQRARQVHARKDLQRTVSAHSDSMHHSTKTHESGDEQSLRPTNHPLDLAVKQNNVN